ncbi:uncharacterized protein LOC118743756 [Rhagoletis pomonella]|uniref:uncharacterized protein LOC118743756 n=1 Tax=Rhagoletis pomonella TaxID=28610 RepID=UPI0017800034|nr:uncharacterized protein LOC118743756 [Rhagoletis pomonella]
MKHFEYLLFPVFFALLQLKIQNVLSRSNFDITYKGFNCTTIDPKGYVAKVSCFISKNTKRSSISTEMQFKRDLNYFSINILVVMPRSSEDFVLINMTRIKGCEFMANKNQVPILQLVVSSMSRYGNLLNKCPYKRDTLYYLRGFHLDLNSIPAIAFETDLKTWFDFTYERDILFSGYVHSSIRLRRNG